jgi:hypothetical protein
MEKRGLLESKKAESQIYSLVVFIIINVVVFSLLFAFFYRVSYGAFSWEQTYAKEIALILDKGKSGTEVFIDFERGFELLEKENIPLTDSVRYKDGIVFVRLSNSEPYTVKVFSDKEARISFIQSENKLKVKIL